MGRKVGGKRVAYRSRLLRQCVVQNFYGMLRNMSYAVLDLVPAARARRSDDCIGRGRAHRGKEYESANLH